LRNEEYFNNTGNYGAVQDDALALNSVPLNSLTSVGSIDNLNQSTNGTDDDEDEGHVNKYKKDKSLGILCQQFIGLFVTWKRVISLEEAAR